MRKIFALTIALLLVSISSFALSKPTLTCKSIDVTYRPFYKVEIYQFDITHPGYYGAVIEKVVDLAGTKKETVRKEGPGKITKNKFKVVFGTYWDGLFVNDGDDIRGTRLSNGVLKGEMNLGDDRGIELVCRN